MPININTSEISDIRCGDDALTAVYCGENLLWPEPAIGTNEVAFLVIGGGGGGGFGGGGAGGYRTSWLGDGSELSGANSTPESHHMVATGTSYSIIVGSGGNGIPAGGGASAATDGGSSRFDTIISAGGGAGARSVADAGIVDGGSGGGEGFPDTPDRVTGTPQSPNSRYQGMGTANQGMDGGQGHDYSITGQFAGEWAMGGGGGASQAGGNGNIDSGVAGTGGNGLTSTITGTAVTRGGGGGGSGWSPSLTASGGTGGGGQGSTTGSNGTANTGGGGGAGGNSSQSGANAGAGGSGGSGLVVLRYNGMTATYTAGLTVASATVDGDTVDTITAGSGTVTFS